MGGQKQTNTLTLLNGRVLRKTIGWCGCRERLKASFYNDHHRDMGTHIYVYIYIGAIHHNTRISLDKWHLSRLTRRKHPIIISNGHVSEWCVCIYHHESHSISVLVGWLKGERQCIILIQSSSTNLVSRFPIIFLF